MKQIILLLSLAMISVSPLHAQQSVDTKSKLYNYKCHMKLADNREVIRDYRRQPKNQHGNLEKLLVNQQVVVERNQRLTILQVYECVDVREVFTSAKARKLDEETLR